MSVYARLKISGRVQGVFYRVSTRDRARELGLSGFVRNVSDGSVEVLVTGDRGLVEELISWCHRGPSGSRVDTVVVEWLEAHLLEVEEKESAVLDFHIR
ncbi:MAG: acylphosphatase [Candidatus Obscuribacterales bacterium]